MENCCKRKIFLNILVRLLACQPACLLIGWWCVCVYMAGVAFRLSLIVIKFLEKVFADKNNNNISDDDDTTTRCYALFCDANSDITLLHHSRNFPTRKVNKKIKKKK